MSDQEIDYSQYIVIDRTPKYSEKDLFKIFDFFKGKEDFQARDIRVLDQILKYNKYE